MIVTDGLRSKIVIIWFGVRVDFEMSALLKKQQTENWLVKKKADWTSRNPG